MVEGDQKVACLDYLAKLEGKHPERACLMSVRSILELSLDKLDSGWTITASHIEVVGKVPGADAATFQKYAEAAEKGCPVSKVLNAKITMNAKLE